MFYFFHRAVGLAKVNCALLMIIICICVMYRGKSKEMLTKKMRNGGGGFPVGHRDGALSVGLHECASVFSFWVTVDFLNCL